MRPIHIKIGHLLRNIKFTNSPNIRSLILEKNYQAESRNTYLPPPQNNYRQNRDRRQEGTRIEPSIACFVTMKGIPEIYVQLKTKHVIIEITIGHFSGACLNVKRPQ